MLISFDDKHSAEVARALTTLRVRFEIVTKAEPTYAECLNRIEYLKNQDFYNRSNGYRADLPPMGIARQDVDPYTRDSKE